MFGALSLLGWPDIVSEDSLGSTSCGENARVLMRKEYLEDIGFHHGDLCRVFEIFSSKKGEIFLGYTEIMLGTWPLLEEEKQLVDWIRQGQEGSQVFPHVCKRGSKSCIV
ncbi:ATV_HP_G0084470.mRNA.1.CDS.1 [Saccharomyces cerevisiae]|nr:ATV_HP_G0084470.mRNA.1.CDS.1 [Saccharomyces cerevisiae]CAI6445284.1 ATV_HP_G0084470.mRNA.1.CDS.1 [Saccharomyces cerevisiae]